MLPKTVSSSFAIGVLLVSGVLGATVGGGDVDAQQAPAAQGLVVVESTQSFGDTWSSLLGALDANSAIRTIATVDHGAAATSAGLSIAGNRVVFFGNPNLGTPIMQASRTAALDLPQKMQVFQFGDRVFVSYNPTSYLATRHQTGAVATLEKIDGALAGLARTATNTQGALGAPLQPSPGSGAGLTTTTSLNDFETTWSQLLAAIDSSPATVAFTVDHGANSGGTLGPTRLVVFGNPQIGTPIMASAATAGVDLPLKMLVFEDGQGVTHVASTSPGFVQTRHGVGSVPTIGAATGAIANFTTAATTVAGEVTASPPGGTTGRATGSSGGQLAFTGPDAVAATLGGAMLAAGGALVVGGRRRRH